MAIRIGLNGFGRIGRYLVRLLADQDDIEIACINARADNESLAHLLKYDSIHRRFPYPVLYDNDGLWINNKHVKTTQCKTGEWQWDENNIDIAIEGTGSLKDREGLTKHLDCGAKKVIISAPGKDVDLTVVMGVNDKEYDPNKHHIISAASCTTNCLAPVAKVIQDNFGIKHGLMTTIHSYTMSQRILDGSHKDLRRARACAVSLIPTTTGAAKATALVIPELKGKLDGMAVRVPTPNVSLVDLVLELEKSTSVLDVNTALKEASNTYLKDNLGFSDEPLVSVDYQGTTFAGIVDAELTTVIGGTMLKLIVWYDNEAGFTNQLSRLIHLVGNKHNA